MAGLYFEEFTVGQKITSVGRTVTEGDIMSFAGLTGDYNQIHTDAAFAAGTQFGQRIAHGLLGLSIAVGLLMRTGVLEGTVLAFREINESVPSICFAAMCWAMPNQESPARDLLLRVRY